jgi:soluble lytic murein transglycosylase-like protein
MNSHFNPLYTVDKDLIYFIIKREIDSKQRNTL